ncbi:hypothetical protein [Paludifilum halophilum]|uniref:Uncharacterized protein n=1 Tax=Paludifilum halophilum TaxID=1642702 RepID=A0A235B8H4_9BACL|nr:hypothetical protein [Paludifilum halophilum]OYD08586.1 hypothetical protein CHM34_07110 [Paludifilum halophilum]
MQGSLDLFEQKKEKNAPETRKSITKRKTVRESARKTETVAPTTVYRCPSCDNAIALHIPAISVECGRCRKKCYEDTTLDTQGPKQVQAVLNL